MHIESMGNISHSICGSRKFCQRGSKSDKGFFLVDEGRENPNTTKSGPSLDPPAKQHLNGVSLAALCWPNIGCWLGSFVIFHMIRTSFSKKPYICVKLQGGPDPLSFLWIHAWLLTLRFRYMYCILIFINFYKWKAESHK